MNIKKLVQISLAALVTTFVTNFIIHNLIMKATYQATAYLWRPEAEMAGFMPFMLAGQTLVSVFFAWIFSHGYKGTGVGEGIRYGLLFAGYSAGQNFIMYTVTPYTSGILWSWIVLGGVQAVLTGVICALVAGSSKG